MNSVVGNVTSTAERRDGCVPQRALDTLACNRCGRWFCVAPGAGPRMIAALRGGCPRCGGRFELVSDHDAEPEQESTPTQTGTHGA